MKILPNLFKAKGLLIFTATFFMSVLVLNGQRTVHSPPLPPTIFNPIPNCQSSIPSDNITFINLLGQNAEVAWTLNDEVSCYLIELKLYWDQPIQFISGIAASATNTPFYQATYQVSFTDAFNYAQNHGIPPGYLAWNMSYLINNTQFSNYYIAVLVHGYEDECPDSPRYNCPNGGPAAVSSTINCVNQNHVIAVCGRREDQTTPADLLAWLNCVAGEGCFSWSLFKRDTEPMETYVTELFPNPAIGEMSLSFSNTTEGAISASIYDIQGREVKRLLSNHYYASGFFELTTDVSRLEEGTYIIRITSPSGSETMKFIKAH